MACCSPARWWAGIVSAEQHVVSDRPLPGRPWARLPSPLPGGVASPEAALPHPELSTLSWDGVEFRGNAKVLERDSHGVVAPVVVASALTSPGHTAAHSASL